MISHRHEFTITCRRCKTTEKLFKESRVTSPPEIGVGDFPGWILISLDYGNETSPDYQYLCHKCKSDFNIWLTMTRPADRVEE